MRKRLNLFHSMLTGYLSQEVHNLGSGIRVPLLSVRCTHELSCLDHYDLLDTYMVRVYPAQL